MLRHKAAAVGFAGLLVLLAVGLAWWLLWRQVGPYDDYLARLSRVLDVAQDASITAIVVPLPAIPERAALYRDVEAPRLSPDALWALRSCDFLHQVAQANSSLGKVMSDAARLQHERGVLQGMQDCLAELDAPAQSLLRELMTQLAAIQDARRWNAVVASKELRRHWTLARGALQARAPTPGTELAMDRLQQWLAGQAYPLAEIERALGALYHDPSGGQWLRTLQSLTQALERGSAIIQQRLDTRPICYREQGNARSQRLLGILYKVYNPLVQADAARASQATRRYRDWLSAVGSVEVWGWFDDLVPRYERALRAHTLAWQAMLKQCGALPSVAEN